MTSKEKKLLRIRRNKLQDLTNGFEVAQTVTKHADDDRADLMAFKIAAGRNFHMCHNKCKDIAYKLVQLENENPLANEYLKFHQECTDRVAEKYALRDVDGELIFDDEGNIEVPGDVKYDFTDIQERYSDVIESFNETNKKIEKYLNGYISVRIDTFPSEKIPVNISGSYLNCIKCMIQ